MLMCNVEKHYNQAPKVIKLFFNLNSCEHEILTAHKYSQKSMEIFRFKSQKLAIYPANKC